MAEFDFTTLEKDEWDLGQDSAGDKLRQPGREMGQTSRFDFSTLTIDRPDEDPDTKIGGALSTFTTLAAGVGQFSMFLAKGLWDTADSAKRVSGAVADSLSEIGLVPDALNPFRFTEEIFRIVDEGLDLGDFHIAGTGEVADAIGNAADILPELFPSFARLGVKAEDADEAWDALWKEGEWELMQKVVTDPEAWAGFIGNALPSLFLAWRSGGSLPFIAWLESLDAAENARDYEERTGEKIDDANFVTAVGIAGGINAFLEKAGLDSVLGRLAKPGRWATLRGFLTGMAGEGSTEGLQEITQNLAALSYDEELRDQATAAIDEGEWAPFFDRMTEGIVPAIMGGSGPGGVIGGFSARTANMAERQQGVRDSEGRLRAAGKPSIFGSFGRTDITDEEAKELGLKEVEVTADLLDRVGKGQPLNANEQYTLINQKLARFVGDIGNETVILIHKGIQERERLGPITEGEEIVMEGDTVTTKKFDMETIEADVSEVETFVTDRNVPRDQKEPRRSIRERLKRAISRTDTSPTDAQIEAGNYRKGRLRIQGLSLSVENPKGSVRSGTDRAGKTWQRRLADTYGYIKGTVGKDKDHIDAFIGDYPESDTVVIVNQKKDASKPLTEDNFDEHKVMIGYRNVDDAIKAYNRNYDDRGALKGTAIQMSMAEFKVWLAKGDTKKIAESDRETLYRGESAITKGGPSYSGSKSVAEQFAEGEPIIERTIKKSDIYEATDVSALDQEAVDAVIKKARAKGQRAVRLSEGVAAAPSVLVFDHEALRDDTVFPVKQKVSRRTNDGRGMSVSSLQKAVRPFYLMFTSAPPVYVVESIEDLPTGIQQQLKSANAEKVTNGVYTQDALTDRIYLIANNTSNSAEGVETLIHEIIGHYGLHQIVPVHLFDATMDKIAKSFPKEVREAARVQGLDFTDEFERRIAAEEFIAYTAQKILQKRTVSEQARKFVDDLVKAIQNLLRQAFGKDVLFTNGQVMSMIAQASDYVQGNSGYVRDKQRGYRRHIKNPTYFSQMFKWLNDESAKSMTAENWQTLIKGAMRKNRIKEEEVMWSGMMEWLEDLTWGDVVTMVTTLDAGLVSQPVWEAYERYKRSETAFDGAQQRYSDAQKIQQDEPARMKDATYTFDKARKERSAAHKAWDEFMGKKADKIPKEAIMRFIQINGVEIEIVPFTSSTGTDFSGVNESYPDNEELEETDETMDEEYDYFKENSGYDQYQADALEEVHVDHKYEKDLTAEEVRSQPQMLLLVEEGDDLENMDVEELNTLKGEWDGMSVVDMEDEADDMAREAFDSEHYESFKDTWESEHTRRTWYAGEHWIIEASGSDYFSAYNSETGDQIDGFSSFDDTIEALNEHANDAEYDEDGEMVGKWSEYTIPGGEGYSEYLFRWKNPDEELFSESVHWGGATNFVVHVRFDIRKDEDGNDVIFVDELQSDWHQAGRQQGLKSQAIADDALQQRQDLWKEYIDEDQSTFQSEMVEWDLTADEVNSLEIHEQVRDEAIRMLSAFRQSATKRESELSRRVEDRSSELLSEVYVSHGYDARLSRDANEVKAKVIEGMNLTEEDTYPTSMTFTPTTPADEILEILQGHAEANMLVGQVASGKVFDADRSLHWDGTSQNDMDDEAHEKARKQITMHDIGEDVVDMTWADWLNEKVYQLDVTDDQSNASLNHRSVMRMAVLYKGMASAVYGHTAVDGFKPRKEPGPHGVFVNHSSRAGGMVLDFSEAYSRYRGATGGVAPAPFEATWQLLVIKAIVKEAVALGHKKIFFAPGEIHSMGVRWGGATSVNGVDWAAATFKQTLPAKRVQIGRWKYTQKKPEKIKPGEEKEREVEVKGVTIRSVTYLSDPSTGAEPVGEDQRRNFGEWQDVPIGKLHTIVGADVATKIKQTLEKGQNASGLVHATDVGRMMIQYADQAHGGVKHLTGSRQVYNVITPNIINSKFLKKYKTAMKPGGRVFNQEKSFPDTDVQRMESVYGLTGGIIEPVPGEGSIYDDYSVKQLTSDEVRDHVSSHAQDTIAGEKAEWWGVYNENGDVRTDSISHGGGGSHSWLSEARAREARQYFDAMEIIITPELAEAAAGGFPLFSRKDVANEGPYQIIDRHTGQQVGKNYQGKNALTRARNRVDKLDNEYGAYRYRVHDTKRDRPRFSKKRGAGRNLHQKYTGDSGVDSALDWAGLNIGPPKMRSIERLQQTMKRVIGIEGKLRRMEQLLVDQFAGIKWAIHEVHGRHLSAEESGYKQAHFTTSGDSQMYAFLMHGLPTWEGGITQIKEGTKGLLEVLEPIVNNIDRWGYWMAARRAKRLMEEGREHLFSDEHIADLLKLGGDPESGVDAMFPEFQEVADEYAAWNSAFLDWASDAGVINETTRPLWENADYVPFYRIKADELGGSFDTRAATGASGIANQINPIKRLKGGTEKLGDITENIIINLSQLAGTAMKNQAMRTTIKNLEGSGLIDPVPASEWMQKEFIPMDELKRKLKAAGVEPASMTEEALKGMQQMWTLKPPTGGDIVTVMENGKKKYYRVTETTLFRSLTAINQTKFNSTMGRMFMFPFRSTKRLLTSMITLAPGFMVANWFRDVAMAFVNSRHAKWSEPRFDRSVTGLLKAHSQSKEMVSMMAAGGAFYSGYINAMDPAATTRSLKRAMRKSGVRNRILDAPWKYATIYNDLGAAAENANRIGHAYIPAIKAGASTAEAVWEAKDLMNFAKHGDAMAMQFLVQSTPFLNARIQGLVRWGQRFREAPGATFMKSFMYTLAVMAVYWGNKDDERYKELTDEDKDMYIHFWINGHHWRLPKAFEVGSLFGTVPERMFEWMYSEEDDRTRLALDRMKFVVDSVFMVNVNPLRMVQFIKPFYEASTNWNSFFQAPIVPEYMQDMAEAKPDMVHRNSTSPLSRELVKVMPRFAPHTLRNPMLLEHVMRGYTGTLGSYAMLMTDALVRSAFDYPPRPKLRWDQTPMASRFYRGDDPVRRTGYENMMYEIIGAARGITDALNVMEREGLDAEMTAFRNEPSEYHARYTNWQIEQSSDAMSGQYDAVRDLRKEANMIWQHEDWSPSEKLRRMNEVQIQINKMTKQAYELRPGSSTTDYTPFASLTSTLTAPILVLLEDLDGQDQAGSEGFLRGNGLTDTADLIASLPARPRDAFRDLMGINR